MTVFVSLLRGVNVGGHRKIKMESLRDLYGELGLSEPRTYVQSGNVVFRMDNKRLSAKFLEDAIERKFGFRAGVVLRTAKELRETIARNPFANRKDIDPAKLLVSFLAAVPGKHALASLREVEAEPEELHVVGREIFIYFPSGVGHSKFPWAKLDRILHTTATGRNLRTVLQLLAVAESMEASVGN